MISIDYEVDEKYIFKIPPGDNYFEMFISFLSWFAFLCGVIVYFTDNDKYFFKWSKKNLWIKYNKNN